MALIKCKECNSEVSSKADICPKCGIRITPKPKGCLGILGTLILFFIGLFIMLVIFTGITSSYNSKNAPFDLTDTEKTASKILAKTTNLPILNTPFYKPSQYVGMTIAQAETATEGTVNKAGNIVIDIEQAHMLLESSDGSFVDYVEVALKKTAPCNQSVSFDAEPILGALSINPAELAFIRKQTLSHVYYDHKRKLKVNVICLYNGAPLSVGFSSKYYGM
jgi:hypothetical protein